MENSFDLRKLYTKKHKRLERVAYLTNLLAWLIIILSIVYLIGVINLYRNILPFGMKDFLEQGLLFVFSTLYSPFLQVFKSLVLALVLKGASLGLYMIIETDINYRSKNNQVEEQ